VFESIVVESPPKEGNEEFEDDLENDDIADDAL
jgi:hypothetical protein